MCNYAEAAQVVIVIGQAIYGTVHLRILRGRGKFTFHTLIVWNTTSMQSIRTNAR